MSVVLTKGQTVDLTKGKQNLTQINMCLGWNPMKRGQKLFRTEMVDEVVREPKSGFLANLLGLTDKKVVQREKQVEIQTSNYEMDIDASVMFLENGKLVKNTDVVYFGRQESLCGSIVHSGDNLTGSGSGDDEVIQVFLPQVPSRVDRIVFFVNIYQCTSRGQHFGMVEDAYIRIENPTNKQELARFNLTDDYSKQTAIICGELVREAGDWKFKALGTGSQDTSISEITARYK
ncbi:MULTISPECIES: TerD family protein [Bacillus cereus group]|uniref:TerD family protein n=1 Tax=Bacillus cereus group TaxID=86661 RepID=UPI000B44D624|nr:TerD family protein [Bacillus thuringiensis]MEB9469471.1 TerD family protein [Bacillus cereus]MRA82322.1 TerD family protein [Bacillus thuringiensis]OUA18946.1 hypothetical protein BK776_27910 [Bacillus thuringiensis serovar aizawai]